jgi:hypothetical protein
MHFEKQWGNILARLAPQLASESAAVERLQKNTEERLPLLKNLVSTYKNAYHAVEQTLLR